MDLGPREADEPVCPTPSGPSLCELDVAHPIVSDLTGTDSVEGETAEAVIRSKAIGERIRRLRLKRSIGLVELGRRTGLSASFLSQLET